jgi:hypothetical protein
MTEPDRHVLYHERGCLDFNRRQMSAELSRAHVHLKSGLMLEDM